MNNITLIGMPGAGKSSIGVVLAKVLGYQFIDSDLLIQKADEYDGKKVTSCRLMTSVNESIVPMEYVEIFAANNDLDSIGRRNFSDGRHRGCCNSLL